MWADCANYAKFADRILVSSIFEMKLGKLFCVCDQQSSYVSLNNAHSRPTHQRANVKISETMNCINWVFSQTKSCSAHICMLKLLFTSSPVNCDAAYVSGNVTIFGKHKTCNKVRCSLSSWCCSSKKTISIDADDIYVVGRH